MLISCSSSRLETDDQVQGLKKVEMQCSTFSRAGQVQGRPAAAGCRPPAPGQVHTMLFRDLVLEGKPVYVRGGNLGNGLDTPEDTAAPAIEPEAAAPDSTRDLPPPPRPPPERPTDNSAQRRAQQGFEGTIPDGSPAAGDGVGRSDGGVEQAAAVGSLEGAAMGQEEDDNFGDALSPTCEDALDSTETAPSIASIGVEEVTTHGLPHQVRAQDGPAGAKASRVCRADGGAEERSGTAGQGARAEAQADVEARVAGGAAEDGERKGLDCEASVTCVAGKCSAPSACVFVASASPRMRLHERCHSELETGTIEQGHVSTTPRWELTYV